MILGLDTSTPTCKLVLFEDNEKFEDEWLAERTLAKNLLGYLIDTLDAKGKTFGDITGIVAFRGPGSFTGLRIGLTVLNTIADSENIPIVGATGEQWFDEALGRLEAGENDKIVLPFYGSAAHITKPRK